MKVKYIPPWTRSSARRYRARVGEKIRRHRIFMEGNPRIIIPTDVPSRKPTVDWWPNPCPEKSA